MRVADTKRRITEAAEAGHSLDTIDEQIIAGCGATSAVQAALWLYGWSIMPADHQRAFAEDTLALATAREGLA